MRFMKKIGGRGTVTLPRDLREAMDLREGDILEFEVRGVIRSHGRREAEAPFAISGTA